MTQPKWTKEPISFYERKLKDLGIGQPRYFIGNDRIQRGVGEIYFKEDAERLKDCYNFLTGIEDLSDKVVVTKEFVAAAKGLLECAVCCMNVLTEPGIMDRDELDYLKEEIVKQTDGAITRSEKAFGENK